MENSSFGRLAGVLLAPVKTFQSIAERPTWVVALVVLVALALTASVLMTGRMDMEELVRESVAQQGREVSEQQVEQAIEFQEKFGRVLILGSALVVQPVIYLLVALVFWVVFKLVGGDFSYKAGFSVTLHGFMPWAVATVLNIPVILSRAEIGLDDVQGGGGNLLASNLGFLAGEDASAALTALLTSLDLFSIWSAILLGLGFGIAGKVSQKTALVTVAAVWVVYLIGKMGWVSIFS